MYIPEYHRIRDDATALAFMKANPFAIVVSASQGIPFATHIPVVVREAGHGMALRGHVAKANPHWKWMEQEPETLVIFHGPHAYISPALYDAPESVPTWNYAAVHVYGRAAVFGDSERLTETLLELIHAFDPSYLANWSGLGEKFRNRMLSQIVGFEITVTRLEGKFKLSQNRSRADQARIIESLESSEDSTASRIAHLMKGEGLGF